MGGTEKSKRKQQKRKETSKKYLKGYKIQEKFTQDTIGVLSTLYTTPPSLIHQLPVCMITHSFPHARRTILCSAFFIPGAKRVRKLLGPPSHQLPELTKAQLRDSTQALPAWHLRQSALRMVVRVSTLSALYLFVSS